MIIILNSIIVMIIRSPKKVGSLGSRKSQYSKQPCVAAFFAKTDFQSPLRFVKEHASA